MLEKPSSADSWKAPSPFGSWFTEVNYTKSPTILHRNLDEELEDAQNILPFATNTFFCYYRWFASSFTIDKSDLPVCRMLRHNSFISVIDIFSSLLSTSSWTHPQNPRESQSRAHCSHTIYPSSTPSRYFNFLNLSPDRFDPNFLMARREKKSHEASLKDKQECQAKRKEYADYAKWTNHGILKDLEESFALTDPSRRTLLPIVQTLSTLINVPVDRQDKRRKEFLIGWCNKNYDLIKPKLKTLVLMNDKREMKGIGSERVRKYVDENPSSSLVVYITPKDIKDE
jgi:hypothetical protein